MTEQKIPPIRWSYGNEIFHDKNVLRFGFNLKTCALKG